MLDKYQLSDMGKWVNFIGIVNIIAGIINCITIVGIIPGILCIILGMKLRGVKRYSDEIVVSVDDTAQMGSLNLMVSELSSFFKINGILIIIGLVLSVIGLIIGLFMIPLIISILSDPSMYYYY